VLASVVAVGPGLSRSKVSRRPANRSRPTGVTTIVDILGILPRAVAAAALAAALLAAQAGPARTGPAAASARRPDIPSTALAALALTSPRTGYGMFVVASGPHCRDVVGRTTDGGAHFTRPVNVLSRPCASGQPWQLAADSQGDVYLYGPGLLASHDGGRSWSRVSEPGTVAALAPAGRSAWLLRQNCTAGRTSPPVHCRVRLLLSADGGRSWRPSAAQPVTAAFPMASTRYAEAYQGQDWLVRTGRLTGYVLLPPPAGTAGPAARAPLFYTADGGRSWRRSSIPCGRPTSSVTMTAVPGSTALAAVCAGLPGGAAGPHQVKTVATSADGGRTWTTHRPCPLDINKGLNCQLEWGYIGDIAAPRAGTIYMTGTAIALEVSTDGGEHWRFVRPEPGGSGADTTQVRFFSPADGFLVGLDLHRDQTPAIWHTADGGVTWRETIPVLG